MAADILLHQPAFVPVGADQKQHLEIARDIANRFNGIYGNVFTIPEPYIPKVGARVMSLQDPSKKMSKSDENVNAWVAILDSKDDIIRKFKRAVTDSQAVVCIGEDKPGINNLIGIYSAVTGKTADEITKEFEGKGYGDFKLAVGEAVADELAPIRAKYDEYISDKKTLEEIYKQAEKVKHTSEAQEKYDAEGVPSLTTIEEIVKGLELCAEDAGEGEGCLGCPFAEIDVPNCAKMLNREAVKVIRGLQKRLK
jgi:tryptophanyl-tRNA synthetase